MMRKLRTLVAALLLVPALYSNANAFTTDGGANLNPSRPTAAWCFFYWNGMYIVYEC